MDGLRWTLLIIGICLVAAIYFYDRMKRRLRSSDAERFFSPDDPSDFNMTPRPADDGDDYRDALAGLSHMLHENRRSDGSSETVNKVDFDPTAADSEPAHDSPRRDTDASWEEEEAIAEAEIGVSTPAPDTNNDNSEPPEVERLVIFYLKAPPGQAFAGPGLFESLAAAGLSLGPMGIYHDSDSHGQTIFSVANLFEPGTLDIADPDSFSTRGVALFMQLPLTGHGMDEQDAFERLLGKAEILAERLGGELHDEQHQPLDNTGVARARSILKPA